MKVGDIVKLKSDDGRHISGRGGPILMTVEVVEGDTIKTCWFIGCELMRDEFPATALAVITMDSEKEEKAE